MKVLCSNQTEMKPTSCPNRATLIKDVNKLNQVQLSALRSKASVTVTVLWVLSEWLREELTVTYPFWLLSPPPLFLI